MVDWRDFLVESREKVKLITPPAPIRVILVGGINCFPTNFKADLSYAVTDHSNPVVGLAGSITLNCWFDATTLRCLSLAEKTQHGSKNRMIAKIFCIKGPRIRCALPGQGKLGLGPTT